MGQFGMEDTLGAHPVTPLLKEGSVVGPFQLRVSHDCVIRQVYSSLFIFPTLRYRTKLLKCPKDAALVLFSGLKKSIKRNWKETA